MARTVNVYLSDPQAAFVAEEIAAGRAQTVSEVMRQAIEAARRERELHDARLDRLRRDVGFGLEQLDEGLTSQRPVAGIVEEALAERRRRLADETAD